jgi:pantothenate kinase
VSARGSAPGPNTPGPDTPGPGTPDLPALVARASALADSAGAGPGRALLGIAGAPGAGKSTLAAALADALGDRAVVVGMDGFHLAGAELRRLGRADRKGAPDTFDGHGFVVLLERLARRGAATVHAPVFDRVLDEALAGAIAVPPEVPLVIVDGSYLLLEADPWSRVRPLLTEAWFVRLPRGERERRLIARHEHFGAPAARARAHALGSDAANAELVAPTASRADLVVRPCGSPGPGGAGPSTWVRSSA